MNVDKSVKKRYNSIVLIKRVKIWYKKHIYLSQEGGNLNGTTKKKMV